MDPRHKRPAFKFLLRLTGQEMTIAPTGAAATFPEEFVIVCRDDSLDHEAR